MSGEHPGGERSGPGYGWWPSPWPAATVAAGKISRSGLQVDGARVYWSESRPGEDGRSVVVAADPEGGRVDRSPGLRSVRSRVHEYGGAAYVVADGVLYFVDDADQRWYRSDRTGADPTALTPPSGGATVRYADGRLSGGGEWLVSVEERLEEDGTRHRLVAVAVDGTQRIVPLVDRGGFVAAPRPSPDGRWLAWLAWKHPRMSWESSELWVAPVDETADGGPSSAISLGAGRLLAGGEGISVGQPRWCRDGSLLFVDDRSGWWLPYRSAVDRQTSDFGPPRALVEIEAEFHEPDWVLGQSTIVECPDGSLACRLHRDGRDQVVRLRPPAGSGERHWSVEEIPQPCRSVSGLVATGSGALWVLGSTTAEAHGVVELGLAADSPIRRRSQPPEVAPPAGQVSEATLFTAPSPDGPVPGLFFAPVGAEDVRSPASPPPLVVFCHGGPTSRAEAGFDPVIQFFATRGLAVAAVDYRGSSGYGRAFRQRLDGNWGEADIDDCVQFADALARAGLVDGARMAIRGTSAGGLTALGALIRSDRFAGAASWYGVTDLEALAADTHDFESSYIDSLVGPWPDAMATYRSRSPLHHPDRVSGEVLLLQGADDPVVPADHSVRFAGQLESHGVPCRLVVFDGESHGFRRSATIEACLEAELSFYRHLFDRVER